MYSMNHKLHVYPKVLKLGDLKVEELMADSKQMPFTYKFVLYSCLVILSRSRIAIILGILYYCQMHSLSAQSP